MGRCNTVARLAMAGAQHVPGDAELDALDAARVRGPAADLDLACGNAFGGGRLDRPRGCNGMGSRIRHADSRTLTDPCPCTDNRERDERRERNARAPHPARPPAAISTAVPSIRARTPAQ